MLLSPSSGVFFSFSLEAIVPSLSTSFCDFSVFFVVFGYYKALFSRFQDQLEGFFQYFEALQFAFTSMCFIESINLGLGLFYFVSQSLHLIIGSLAIGGSSFLLS